MRSFGQGIGSMLEDMGRPPMKPGRGATAAFPSPYGPLASPRPQMQGGGTMEMGGMMGGDPLGRGLPPLAPGVAGMQAPGAGIGERFRGFMQNPNNQMGLALLASRLGGGREGFNQLLGQMLAARVMQKFKWAGGGNREGER